MPLAPNLPPDACTRSHADESRINGARARNYSNISTAYGRRPGGRASSPCRRPVVICVVIRVVMGASNRRPPGQAGLHSGRAGPRRPPWNRAPWDRPPWIRAPWFREARFANTPAAARGAALLFRGAGR